ncbi:phosphohydrolase [Candidatus Finniella inopinata]|uniref:Phosphohydrolase n=1 Tax=Candidatus Finniella inopinata TaxID=1696036 RepID=A0A4Q7DJA5_9PROT|nr:phosphohydrolase [Candidatus Finniella inopinata]RZI46388.1 phosphohydrolase [Candidatus Finniella inopinata]
MQTRLIVFCVAIVGLLSGCCTKKDVSVQNKIDVIWGTEVVDHPLIQDLIESPVMQRIKDVDQSGPTRYFGFVPAYSRFDHCVGVWALLKRFKCSFPEQVAGLLHDASHTAFSHLGDHIFSTPETDTSYQDTIHLWFLKQMNLESVLKPYGLSVGQVDPDYPGYKGLEQPLPDLCADRIEYNLHTGLLFKLITQQEVVEILNDLRFEGGIWFFTNQQSAKKLADLSLYFTEQTWGSAWNFVFNHYFTEIMKRAFKFGIVNSDQMHFGTDLKIMDILLKTTDPFIQRRIEACRHIHNSFKLAENGQRHDLYVQPKFRGVNPWVQVGQKLHRLTDLDFQFSRDFHGVKNRCKKGYAIVLSVKG